MQKENAELRQQLWEQKRAEQTVRVERDDWERKCHQYQVSRENLAKTRERLKVGLPSWWCSWRVMSPCVSILVGCLPFVRFGLSLFLLIIVVAAEGRGT